MHIFDSETDIDGTLDKCRWKSPMFSHQPLWWQRVGIAWMLGVENTNEETDQFAAKRGILANATGRGKTYKTIATILCSDHGHSNRYSLIIVLSRTRNQWLQEIQRFTISSTDWAIINNFTNLETAILAGKKCFIVSHVKAGQWSKDTDLEGGRAAPDTAASPGSLCIEEKVVPMQAPPNP